MFNEAFLTSELLSCYQKALFEEMAFYKLVKPHNCLNQEVFQSQFLCAFRRITIQEKSQNYTTFFLKRKTNYLCLSNPMLAKFFKNYICIYTYVFSISFHGKSAIVQDRFLINQKTYQVANKVLQKLYWYNEQKVIIDNYIEPQKSLSLM